MSDESDQELNPSELGTKDYWEKIYSEDIDNFEDHGDVGEVWFGRKNALKIVKCITEDLKLSKTDRILDIGCGNGWTLVQLFKNGFQDLVGVDYAPSAINLAKRVLKDYKIDPSNVKFMIGDVLNPKADLFYFTFKLIHDKGTYDAISLNPDNPLEKRRNYVENVHKMLSKDGYLVLVSCNWTEAELTNHFKSHFDVVFTIESPTKKFGGKIGKSLTNIVFKNK